MTKEQLLSTDFLIGLSQAIDRFYDEESGGFNEGYEHFYNAAGQATVVKAACEELGIPCRIVGIEELPEDSEHMEHGNGGYDWAVVDNRWIVDLWAVSYGNEVDTVLMDMNDPQQRDWVYRSLGNPKDWEERPTDPNEMKIAHEIFRFYILPYQAVDDLLGGLPER